MSVQFSSEEVNYYDLGPSPTRMMEKSDDEQTDGTITDDSDSDNASGDKSDYPSVTVIDHRDNDRRMETKTKSSPRGTWLFGFGGGGGGGGGGEGQEDEQEEEKSKLQHDETDWEVPTSSNTKNNSTDAKDVQEYMYKNSTYGDYIVDHVICIPGDFIEGCLCSTDQILGICQTTDFIEPSSGIELCATTHCKKFNSDDDDDDIDVIVSSSSPNMHDTDCLMDILVEEVDDPIDAESTLVEMKGTAASWLNRTKKPLLPLVLKEKKKKNPKVHNVIPTEDEEQGQGQVEKYPRYVPLYVVETTTVGTAIAAAAAAVGIQDKEEELPPPLRKDILETKSTVATAIVTATATTTTTTTTTTATATATAPTTTTTTTVQEQKQEQEQATVLKDDDAVVVVVVEEEAIPTIATTTTTTAAARSNNKSVVVVVEEEEEDPSNISDNNNNNDSNTSNNDNRNRNRNRNNSVVSIIPIRRSLRLENKDSSQGIGDNDTAATDATKKKKKKKKENKISLTKKLNKWKKHFTSSL